MADVERNRDEEGQYSHYPSNKSSTPEPAMGQLLGQSPLAKIGIMLVIAAIIGLILSYTVPWVYTDSENYESDFFGHNLKNSDDEAFIRANIDDYDNAPGLADGGFIFLLIIGIILIILGMTQVSYGQPSIWFSIIGVLLGGIAIIPSLWVAIAGLRFLGLNVIHLITEDSSGVLLFPAAYILLIIGLIFIRKSFGIIRRETAAVSRGW